MAREWPPPSLESEEAALNAALAPAARRGGAAEASGEAPEAARTCAGEFGRSWQVVGRSWEIAGGRGGSWEVTEGHGRSWEVVGGRGTSWEVGGRSWEVVGGRGR